MWIFNYSYLPVIKLHILRVYINLLSYNLVGLAYWRFWFWSGLIFVDLFTVFCDLYSLIGSIIFFFVVVIFTMEKLAATCSLIGVFGSGRSCQFNFIGWILFHGDATIPYTRVHGGYFGWIFGWLGRQVFANERIL